MNYALRKVRIEVRIALGN